jgi:hypothetical protein
MSYNDDKNTILLLLIILSILILIRTTMYILFDKNLFNIDETIFQESNKETAELFQAIFSIVRISIVTIIFIKRSFRNDILTYVLGYLAFSSILNIYYQYLVMFNPTSPHIKEIDKLQDINSIILFIISFYIVKHIFF